MRGCGGQILLVLDRLVMVPARWDSKRFSANRNLGKPAYPVCPIDLRWRLATRAWALSHSASDLTHWVDAGLPLVPVSYSQEARVLPLDRCGVICSRKGASILMIESLS